MDFLLFSLLLTPYSLFLVLTEATSELPDDSRETQDLVDIGRREVAVDIVEPESGSSYY